MSAPKKMDNKKNTLIVSVCKKNIVPAFTVNALLGLATLLNALIAGRFIGVGALAAIALVSPIEGLATIMHDIIIVGSTAFYIRYKSEGESRQANRAFGAVLIFQTCFFLLFYLLLGLCLVPILHLFTNDEQLIADAAAYFYPIIIGQPLCRVCLCLEYGFKSDGKVGFFSIRGIIVSVLSLIFELAAVRIFKSGIQGLGISAITASLIGYIWTVSYIFRKECSIRPDLSVIKSFSEMKGYLIGNFKIGYFFAVDDGLSMFVNILLTKMILMTGGTTALACYGIFKPLGKFFETAFLAIKRSFYQLCEMFHSNLDADGLKTVFRFTLIFESVISLFFLALCVIFPVQTGRFFSSDVSQLEGMLSQVMRLCVFTTVAADFSNMLSSFLLACKNGRLANRFNIFNNLGVGFGIACGGFLFGFTGLLAGRALLAISILVGESLVIRSVWKKLMPVESAVFASYSYYLSDKALMENLSDSIYSLFRSDSRLCGNEMSVCLLVEEFNYLLGQENQKKPNKVLINLRIKTVGENYCLIFMDNGKVFNPQVYLNKSGVPELNEISARILDHFSPDATYSRVLDMNISRLFFSAKAKEKN